MKTLIFGLSTLAAVALTPLAAQAADLGGYDEGYSDRGPVVEGPRVVHRDYDYYDGPAIAYYAPRFYRPDPYYAGYYPYRYGYWGGRGYWGHGRYWGHRGYRGWR
jgi:hypothetical protein